MISADLHIHTTASDGVFSPSQAAERAHANGVTVMAVSDHDTLLGLNDASKAAENLGIVFIPGVEISAEASEEVHILGYGVSAGMSALNELLTDMRSERINRSRSMLEKLSALGMPLKESEVPAEADASCGRPQIARGMVIKGYVASTGEAFEKYLGDGCPAYVPRRKLLATDVIGLLRESGAVPVIAHPGLLHMDSVSFAQRMSIWKRAGLMGLEAYHPAHLPSAYTMWDRAARSQGLLVTGGSDFHDLNDNHADIGRMCTYWNSSEEDTKKLLDAVAQARRA